MFRETQMGCYWVWSLQWETNIAAGFINTPLKKKKGQAIPEKDFYIVQVKQNPRQQQQNKQTKKNHRSPVKIILLIAFFGQDLL